jgi:hypothetical protein
MDAASSEWNRAQCRKAVALLKRASGELPSLLHPLTRAVLQHLPRHLGALILLPHFSPQSSWLLTHPVRVLRTLLGRPISVQGFRVHCRLLGRLVGGAFCDFIPLGNCKRCSMTQAFIELHLDSSLVASMAVASAGFLSLRTTRPLRGKFLIMLKMSADSGLLRYGGCEILSEGL